MLIVYNMLNSPYTAIRGYILTTIILLIGNRENQGIIGDAISSANNRQKDLPCSKVCTCTGDPKRLITDCSALNLSKVPNDLGAFTSVLDLSHNSIYFPPRYAFHQLFHLENINLAYNDLNTLPDTLFDSVVKLQTLNLQRNRFEVIPTGALRKLRYLVNLHLDGNPLHTVDAQGFQKLNKLEQLWFNSTNLVEIPTEALRFTTSLKALTFANNKIEEIPNYAFQNLTKLSILLLYQNQIEYIGGSSFSGLNNLQILHLEHNRLSEVPTSLSHLPMLKELSLSNNRISYIPDNSFIHNKHLSVLNIKNNPIQSVGRYAFSNLPQLSNLILSEARKQSIFPDLTGNINLDILALDRGRIEKVPDSLCTQVPNIRSLDIHANQLKDVPKLSKCIKLKALNLKSNNIKVLEDGIFTNLSLLTDLTLSDNLIRTIPQHAFKGLSSLLYLDLQNNVINFIHSKAFEPLQSLEEINLGDNVFPVLPTEGLQNIINLKAFNNYQLKDFPSREHFPKVESLTLSWAYHCCEYISEEDHEETNNGVKEHIKIIDNHHIDIDAIANSTNLIPFDSDMQNQLDYLRWKKHAKAKSPTFEAFEEDLWEEFEGNSYGYPYSNDGIEYHTSLLPDNSPQLYGDDTLVVNKKKVVCKPKPGPFWPCKDLMGWWFIRCGMWAVFLLALLGNGTVLVVSIVGRNKTDVPRFLICNLACADSLMSVYLGFLAVVDASSFGEFKRYAIKWQTSVGCQMAGFLGVLSSELSVYTLTVITMERYYAITHAVHINKRLCFRHASYIMCCGWLFAVTMAILPLVGVSDYRKFAVCLPFETSDAISLGYIAFLMLMNMIAFFLIVGCYGRMYWAIRGSSAWNSNDSRVAKRMAILIFTDFFCWAPISFFSLTAAFGKHLVSLEDAKIFTIFVLPINSCANPFLYAILTKQFKKDCSTFCKRIEESTVNRNINRFNQRNSVTWGSSRRPSALNSFFDKRDSLSRQSVSGGSAQTPSQGNSVLNAIRGFITGNNNPKKAKRTCIHIRGEDLMAALAPNVEACPNPSTNNGGNITHPVFDTAQDVCICHSQVNVSDQEFNSNSDSSTGGTCIAHFFRNSKRQDHNSNRQHKKVAHSLSCPVQKENKGDLSVFQLVSLKCSPGGTRKPNLSEQESDNDYYPSLSRRAHRKLQVNLSACSSVPSPKLLSAGDESVKTNITAETELSQISSCLEHPNHSSYSNSKVNMHNDLDEMCHSDELFPSVNIQTRGDVHFKEKARLLGLNEKDLELNKSAYKTVPVVLFTKSNNYVSNIHNDKGDNFEKCRNNEYCQCNNHMDNLYNSTKCEGNNTGKENHISPQVQDQVLGKKDLNSPSADIISDLGQQGIVDSSDNVGNDQGNIINRPYTMGKLQKSNSSLSNETATGFENTNIPQHYTCDSKFNFELTKLGENKENVDQLHYDKENCFQDKSELLDSNCVVADITKGSLEMLGCEDNSKEIIKNDHMHSMSKVESDDSSSEMDQLLKQ